MHETIMFDKTFTESGKKGETFFPLSLYVAINNNGFVGNM